MSFLNAQDLLFRSKSHFLAAIKNFILGNSKNNMPIILICGLKKCLLFHLNDGVPQKENIGVLSGDLIAIEVYFRLLQRKTSSLISLFPKAVITSKTTL